MKTINLKARIEVIAITLCTTALFSISCNAQPIKKPIREVVVYTRCSSNEVTSDVLYSINQLKGDLLKKHIILKVDKQAKQCGYLFINGNKRKRESFGLTDLDLMQEINSFF